MKRMTILLIISILSIGAILILVLNTFSDKPIYQYMSFTRLYPPLLEDQPKAIDIKYNSYYVAGATSKHIYLGNTTAPLHLLIIKTSFTDTQHVQLRIKNFEKFKYRPMKLRVDSPYFYLTDGIKPALLRGTLMNWQANRFMFDSAYFTEALPISNESFALRAVSRWTNENILGKETMQPPYLQFDSSILEKQIDGLFCTDGMLHYSKELANLVYLYHYRNQFICMDTNLNVLYRGNTIDTISKAQVKVARIESENVATLVDPPLTVNRQSCVSGNMLFVSSGLLAKNDEEKTLKRASIIDVYNLKNDKYQFSFLLFDYKKQKLRTFRVFDDMLVALYDHYLIRYKLDSRYFEKEISQVDNAALKQGLQN